MVLLTTRNNNANGDNGKIGIPVMGSNEGIVGIEDACTIFAEVVTLSVSGGLNLRRILLLVVLV